MRMVFVPSCATLPPAGPSVVTSTGADDTPLQVVTAASTADCPCFMASATLGSTTKVTWDAAPWTVWPPDVCFKSNAWALAGDPAIPAATRRAPTTTLPLRALPADCDIDISQRCRTPAEASKNTRDRQRGRTAGCENPLAKTFRCSRRERGWGKRAA